jgi:hypothetical protein
VGETDSKLSSLFEEDGRLQETPVVLASTIWLEGRSTT